MIILSKSAFAKKQGWVPSYVTKLVQQGRIVLTDDGKVDVLASLEKLKATERGRGDVAERNAQNRQGGQDKTQKVADLQVPIDELPEGSRAKYKAVTMQYENQLMMLNMALKKSLRFHNTAVREEAAGIGNSLRAAMERLSDVSAPALAVAKTREERLRILQANVRPQHKAMKNAFVRAFRQLSQQKGV